MSGRSYFNSHSTMMGKSLWWEHKVDGPMASTVREQRETSAVLGSLSLPFSPGPQPTER